MNSVLSARGYNYNYELLLGTGLVCFHHAGKPDLVFKSILLVFAIVKPGFSRNIVIYMQ